MEDMFPSASAMNKVIPTSSLHLAMMRMSNLLCRALIQEVFRTRRRDLELTATQLRSERLRRLSSSPLLPYVVLLQGLLNGDDLPRLLQALLWVVRIRSASIRLLPIPALGLEVSPVRFELTLESTLPKVGALASDHLSVELAMNWARQYRRRSRLG
jgi:hypothetical protein